MQGRAPPRTPSKGKVRSRTCSWSLIPLFCSCLHLSDGHDCLTLSIHFTGVQKQLSLLDNGDVYTCACFSVQNTRTGV